MGKENLRGNPDGKNTIRIKTKMLPAKVICNFPETGFVFRQNCPLHTQQNLQKENTICIRKSYFTHLQHSAGEGGGGGRGI
jgi:hypothetical protein